MSQYYIFRIELNLQSDLFEGFFVKDGFYGESAFIESQHYNNYELCVKECNYILKNIKDKIENDEEDLLLGWEANPKRSKNKKTYSEEEWDDQEILKIFLFPKNENHDKIFLATATIIVAELGPEVTQYLN